MTESKKLQYGLGRFLGVGIAAGLLLISLTSILACSEYRYGARDAPPELRKDKIAYRNGRDIIVMNVDGSDRDKIAGDTRAFAFSPDGTHIALVSDRDSLMERRAGRESDLYFQLYMLDLEAPDATPERITAMVPSLAADVTPVWLGDRVEFLGDGDERYVINPDGTGLTRFTDDVEHILSLVWCAHEERIVFDSWGEIYVKTSDSESSTRLTNTEGWEFFPDWSPDCEKIAYVDVRISLDADDLYVMNSDGSGKISITRNFEVKGQRSRASRAEWSPDGTWILFNFSSSSGFETVESNTYIAAADGSRVIEVEGLHGVSAVWVPSSD